MSCLDAATRSKISAVILDIEGTVMPISFIHDVLFPYVRNNLEYHLNTTFDTAETQSDIVALKELSDSDQTNNLHFHPICDLSVEKTQLVASVIKNVLSQMDVDRKTTALKSLQGHICANGFASGKLSGQVYDDAVRAIHEWYKNQVFTFIYSSGSVEAQQMIFKYSASGDLSTMISGYYDTRIGSKIESRSYRNIIDDMRVKMKCQLSSEQTLFITDNVNEALAASSIGINCVLSIRRGNAELPSNHPFLTIHSFDELSEYFDCKFIG